VRILVWTNSYRPDIGGVEVFLSELAPALRERGHEVAVITDRGHYGAPEREQIDGVSVERLGFNQALASAHPPEVIAVSRQAAESMRRFSPDVVHVNFSDATIFFYLRASAAESPPMALTFHVSPPPERRDGAVRRAMLAAGAVTACSQAILDDALEVVPEQADRAAAIPNGLAGPADEPEPPAPGPPLVVAAGRLVEDKGFDTLIDAMPRLRERVPGARLILAGDGPERAALGARAHALGIADEVELPGWVSPDRIYGLLRQAHVVAIPSRWREPFCLVALQAAMEARPAVATRVGGLPEVVLDGETGLLVGPDDPVALGDALARLLGDSGLAQRLGRQARERALREFGIERCAERYEAMFEELAA
jgi:glycogen(starch) synthase